MNPSPFLVFIVGPTAIGKTRIAVKIALKIGGEIISADSMQAYKGMSILSQAPSDRERKSAPHHLIEFLDPRKEYSVADFIRRASPRIESMIKRGRIPIIVGGSGLYIKGLANGLFPSLKADLKFRARLEKYAARYGRNKLHSKLTKIDPASASSIHPNDLRRIIRALEIHNSTGKTMTELKALTKGIGDKYRLKLFGLTGPREEIYSRVDARVEKMFRDGAVNEAKRLKRKKLSKTANAVLGLKEISEYLDGRRGIEDAMSALKMNTRRFAKRQLTWFGADKRIKWLDVSRFSDADIIRKITKEALWKERC